jgi:transcriptional regulator with XRE-family HTH domain
MAGHPKPSIAMKSIGLRIKIMREKKSLSQTECAKEFGVAPSSWSLIESGKTKFDPDDLFTYAAFFGADPAWLLTGRKELTPAWLLTGEGEMERKDGRDE